MIQEWNLPDIQATHKEGFPNIPIEKVGVRNIVVPFRLFKKEDGSVFNTIATISSYCNLVEDVKGINMSRIGRTVFEVIGREDVDGFVNLNAFAFRLQEAHKTDNIYVKAQFQYIYTDHIPVTGLLTYEPVDVVFETVLKGDVLQNFISVKVVEMSCCPCSREMSLLSNNVTQDEASEMSSLSPLLQKKLALAGFGAHNQRSITEVKVEVNPDEPIWIEDIIAVVRSSVSSMNWSILKRPDEKWVTEVSYMSAFINDKMEVVEVPGYGTKFVEDIGRQVADQLNALLDSTIRDYVIVVNNEESIHSNQIMATAVLTAGRALR